MRKKILLALIFVIMILICPNAAFAKHENPNADGNHEPAFDLTTADKQVVIAPKGTSNRTKLSKNETYTIKGGKKGETLSFFILFRWASLDDGDHLCQAEPVDRSSFDFKVTKMDGAPGMSTCWDADDHYLGYMYITPRQSGTVKFKLHLGEFNNDGTEDIAMTVYIEITDIEKTDEEKIVAEIEAAAKKPELANSNDWKKLSYFIAGDVTKNKIANISTWNKSKVQDRLNTLKNANPDKNDKSYKVYAQSVKFLEVVLSEVEDKEKRAAEEGKQANIDMFEIMNDYKYYVEMATNALMEKISSDSGTPRIDTTFHDVLKNPEKYLKFSKITEEEAQKLSEKVSVIVTIITNVGVVVSVVVLGVIGIKYMFVSVEEKAEYKKDMIPYLIGAILLFGISSILRILERFGQSINGI